MNIKDYFTIFFISILLIGCTSIPEANSDIQTLIIGELQLEASGYSTANVPINGISTVGIDMKIQNTSTGKDYFLRSTTGGVFFSVNVPPGIYRITRLYYKREAGNAWREVWWDRPLGTSSFEVEFGKTNNMGQLHWVSVSGISSTLQHNEGYEQVSNNFIQNNPKSNWLEKEWVSTNIGWRPSFTE